MSTQSDHGHELIPRPEHTPDALRAALVAVEDHRHGQRSISHELTVARLRRRLADHAGRARGSHRDPGRGG